ncbi:MAG: hypothetical protein ABI633_11365 [Burkholderiales bacterium]
MLRNNPRSSSTKERRSGPDRRSLDLERYGRPERRLGVEARKPEVVELDMTNSEWLALSLEPAMPKSPKTPKALKK